MAGEIAVRRLSPEFWAVVGSAITLLIAMIGIAALNLSIAAWLREDIRSVDARVDGLETRSSGEKKAPDAKVATIDKRLLVLEGRVLGIRSIVESEHSDETQTL